MKAILSLNLVLAMAAAANASTLYIGNDTQSPVTVYTSGGTFVQNFGQGGATGSAIDSAGDVWTVAPSFGNNHVVEYDSSQNVLNSFTATIDGQWIEDMSHGSGNTLWVGTFEGDIFALNDQTGAILSQFTVANSSFTGVAFDGTNLWSDGGLTSHNLFLYSTGGTLLNTIAISTTCGGLGYDASDNSLYCGDFGSVHHYSTTGTLLGSFSTGSSAYHDGLEVANLGATTATPEPGTLPVVAAGLIGLVATKLRRKK